MVNFECEKITPTTTRIRAPSLELMYLVEGKEKAALIDTGSGIGHLRAVVEKLTDKPIIVLLTHGHVDHAMGAGEFETVYMNHVDDYIYEQHADMDFRKDGLFLCPQKEQIEEDEMIPAMALDDIEQMAGGDSFDLGGLHIDIYDCPGHTRGSVVMLIREERVLLLGDACNYLTFLHEPYSTTVSEYAESLRKLKPQVAGKYDTVYLSHGPGNGDVRLINGVIGVCEDILAGRTDDVPFGFKDSMGFLAKAEIERDVRADGGIGNVIYNKDRCFSIESDNRRTRS